MNILIILSSVGRIPGTDRGTGTWYEELAAPYYILKQAGAALTAASPAGGPAPLDPLSERDESHTPATRRFDGDTEARAFRARTLQLASIHPEQFDAVLYPGGLGPVFDLSRDARSLAVIEHMFAAHKPVAAVCHGLAALLGARDFAGNPVVSGRAVTGFSNSEELAVNGEGLVPWRIEDELRRLGGRYTRAADWEPHVTVDGNLISGQNPASSAGVAQKMLEALR